jgi:hypothetical protein
MIGLLTDTDVCLIVDALHGVWIDPAWSARELKPLLRAELEDAIRLDGLDDKWQMNGAVLLAKVEDLRDDQVRDVIDVAGWFWEAVARSEGATTPTRELITRAWAAVKASTT